MTKFQFGRPFFRLGLLLIIPQISICLVRIRPIPPAYLGNTVTISCDITNESLVALFWRRYSYDMTSYLNLLQGNLPARYSLVTTQFNATYILSQITISGVTSDDFATYQCSSLTDDSKNLTEAPPTTTSTTLATTPGVLTSLNQNSICYNGNYNSVLYTLLLISLIILIALLFGFLRFLKPITSNNILMAVSCIIGSFGFIIITVVFWISPESISSYPSGIYWAPVVILPHEILAFATIWFGILFFTFRSLKSQNPISLFSIVVIVLIAFSHLVLLLVILCSVVYCTGASAFPSSSLNYSTICDICAGLILALSFVFLIYFFWIFKEQLTTIVITPLDKSFRGPAEFAPDGDGSPIPRRPNSHAKSSKMSMSTKSKETKISSLGDYDVKSNMMMAGGDATEEPEAENNSELQMNSAAATDNAFYVSVLPSLRETAASNVAAVSSNKVEDKATSPPVQDDICNNQMHHSLMPISAFISEDEHERISERISPRKMVDGVLVSVEPMIATLNEAVSCKSPLTRPCKKTRRKLTSLGDLQILGVRKKSSNGKKKKIATMTLETKKDNDETVIGQSVAVAVADQEDVDKSPVIRKSFMKKKRVDQLAATTDTVSSEPAVIKKKKVKKQPRATVSDLVESSLPPANDNGHGHYISSIYGLSNPPNDLI